VVDEDINAPQRICSGGDVGCDRILVGQVAHSAMLLYAMGGDLGRCCIERRASARADGYAGTCCGKAERNRAPDAPATTRDDHPLSFQVYVHLVLSMRFPDAEVVMAGRGLSRVDR